MKIIQIVFFTLIILQSSISQTATGNSSSINIQKFFESYEDNLKMKSNFSYIDGTSVKKSIPLAVGLSFLFPGMGELYVGDYRVGKYLTGSEIALWISYLSMNFYGKWIRDDARTFASIHANVSLTGKDSKYFVNIGNYSDIYQYNERKLQERKETQLYDPNSDYYWKWNSEENRLKYRQMRIKSDDVLNNTQFILGAILANHIISAVNAGRLAIKYNSNQHHVFQINTNVKGTVEHPIVMLTLSKIF